MSSVDGGVTQHAPGVLLDRGGSRIIVMYVLRITAI